MEQRCFRPPSVDQTLYARLTQKARFLHSLKLRGIIPSPVRVTVRLCVPRTFIWNFFTKESRFRCLSAPYGLTNLQIGVQLSVATSSSCHGLGIFQFLRVGFTEMIIPLKDQDQGLTMAMSNEDPYYLRIHGQQVGRMVGKWH